jgi:hypothetical protein
VTADGRGLHKNCMHVLWEDGTCDSGQVSKALRLCMRCGGSGHLARNCTVSQVRAVTTETAVEEVEEQPQDFSEA